MRVLSDGARRLINEMKKLRLSLIFNEQACARARAPASASADTMAVGPRAPAGPEYHLFSGRVADCAHVNAGSLSAAGRVRSFSRVRAVSPMRFLRGGAALWRNRQVRAALAVSFAAIVQAIAVS